MGDCPAAELAVRHAESDVPRSCTAAWQSAPLQRYTADGPRTVGPEVRMSQTRCSYEPTRLTTGRAATTAPTGPCDQP